MTRIYKQSDLEALKKKEEIKRKLGVPADPKQWSHEDLMKVDRYFRSIGWDMAMSGCNPESFFWKKDPVTNKALCMLYNELMIARAGESLRSARRDLAYFGSIYQKHYEEVEKRVQSRVSHLSEYNQIIKVRVEKNTGKKTSTTPPTPKPVLEKLERNTGIKSVPKPEPKPTIVATRVPTNAEPHTVHVTSVREQKPKKIDLKKVGLAIAALAVLYFVRRR
ncbi:hypothetical protein [Thermococcus sp.]|uniref:hypothetical protein n=1 Tax=Thermococcus sp. TaxID=35749 RepID=UPI0025D4A509|nr:hypothetical protein [Thermococcus sp.]